MPRDKDKEKDDYQISFSDLISDEDDADGFAGGTVEDGAAYAEGSEDAGSSPAEGSTTGGPAEKEKEKKKRRTKKALKEIEEKIIDVEYSEVMRKSYIDYSMSVITSRAIPDVRDGLKPVQRRLLYDMGLIGAASSQPHRKVARIVGDTMGKFHPHGDSSLEDALVVMAQGWKRNAPMVDGHGNFGSIEGDTHAASRYIEARLTKYSEDVLLSDIKENTVDFAPNYDEQEKEPVILPAKLPNLLINGSEGIAVGMATNIPTHNLGEVCDAFALFIDNPKVTNEEIMEALMGPDFPTGGIIANAADLPRIYEEGLGKIRLRGKVHIEEGKNRDYIVITEIPYTMVGEGINKFMQAVADLVENKTLPEITDIANQSSKEGIRISIEVRKGADLNYILSVIYKKTKLEDTFGYNFLAISKGKPEQMPIVNYFRDVLEFQEEVYTRKFESLLKKAEKKREVDEGLILAIDIVDTIVEVLRGSKKVAQAKECLMTGNTEGIVFKTAEAEKLAKKLNFTELQADSILELRLARLVGLELTAIEEDLAKVNKNIRRYEKLLKSKAELKKEIKSEVEALKEKYASPRKTQLLDLEEVVIEEKPEEVIPVVVLVDRFHYVHAVTPASYEKSTSEGDYKYVFETETDKRIIAFSDAGKAHTIKVKDIPLGKMKDKGVPIDNISGYSSKEEQIVCLKPFQDASLVFVSSDGYVKVVDMKEFDVTRKTVDSTKLTPGAKVVSVQDYTEGPIALHTKKGYHIRFMQTEIPVQGKVARGARGIKIDDSDAVVKVDEGDRLKFTKRGGKGRK